jgi:hypothetical protein
MSESKDRDPAHTAGMFLATMIGGAAGADVVVLATRDGVQVHVLTEKAGKVAEAAGEKLEDRETDRDGAFKLLRAFVEGDCKVLGLGHGREPAWLTYNGKGSPNPEKAPDGVTIQ